MVVVLGSAALWIYALSGAAKQDPPNMLDDPAFGAAAEPICAAVLEQLDLLPRAEESNSAGERADVLDQSDVLLEDMVDDLSTIPVESARDRAMTTEWVADWRTYIADRADFAARLREDEMSRFYVTEKTKGLQITKAIDDLATVNDMPSCQTPGDLA